MIDFGFIANGPGLMRGPFVKAIMELRAASVSGAPDGFQIEFAYFIPGRLGKADFDGFEVTIRRAPDPRVIVFIAVPEEDVRASDPMSAVVRLAREAIEFCRANRRVKALAALDLDAISRHLDHISPPGLGGTSDVAVSPEAATRRSPRKVPVSWTPDVGTGIEVVLSTPSMQEVDEAFALEEAIEERLGRTDAGYVDGNEVGQGEFRIFTYGPNIDRLRGIVETLVRAKWQGSPAAMRITDNDGKVDFLTLSPPELPPLTSPEFLRLRELLQRDAAGAWPDLVRFVDQGDSPIESSALLEVFIDLHGNDYAGNLIVAAGSDPHLAETLLLAHLGDMVGPGIDRLRAWQRDTHPGGPEHYEIKWLDGHTGVED